MPGCFETIDLNGCTANTLGFQGMLDGCALVNDLDASWFEMRHERLGAAARGFYENETSTLLEGVSWISEDTRVLTMNEGVGTAVAVGETSVIATFGELSARTATTVRNAEDPPTSVAATPNTLTLAIGDSADIQVIATYADTTTGQIGGSWAMLADRYLFNGGCLFDQHTGELVTKRGFGPMVATPEGLLWATGRSLARYRWKDTQRRDRKGNSVRFRALEEIRLIQGDREIALGVGK